MKVVFEIEIDDADVARSLESLRDWLEDERAEHGDDSAAIAAMRIHVDALDEVMTRASEGVMQ